MNFKRLLPLALTAVMLTSCSSPEPDPQINTATLGENYQAGATMPAENITPNEPAEPTEPTQMAVTEYPYSTNIEVNCAVTAEFAAVLDVEQGKVIYDKNASEKLYPASTTKLLTAATALRYCSPDEVFTAGNELDLVSPNSSLAFINKGNSLTLKALVYALMLPSGNDAAYVVAVNVGRLVSMEPDLSTKKAVEFFVQLMNDTAKEIGAFDTHFSNPDGYYADDHYTTARDLLIIAEYASGFDIITEATSKNYAEVLYESGQLATWTNSNYLVDPYGNFYNPECTGLKTGFCDEAGFCLVASAKRGSRNVIAVVMNCEDGSERWNDANRLLGLALSR